MQQVFYIHGGAAFSDYKKYLQYLETCTVRYPHGYKPKRWSNDLQKELGDDFEVFAPQMPNSDNAKYEEWKIWFERHFEFLHDDLILVGWSQGGWFLVKYLTENDLPFTVKALCLVAAPYEADDFGGEDGGDFVFDTKQVGVLTKKAEKIIVIHSEDDFVVPYSHAKKYIESLPEAELLTFVDRNHFLQPKFPELVEKIRELSE